MAALGFEDLSEFFDLNEFATTAILYNAGGAQEIIGIFDEPSVEAEIGQFEIDTVSLTFRCKASEVVNAERGDRLTIDDRELWLTKLPQADGTGLAVLFLAVDEVE